MSAARLVHLVSSDSLGGRQARHYADHIAVVRQGLVGADARSVQVRHVEARSNDHLQELLATPAALTVFVGHSGEDRIGSEDHGWGWLGVGPDDGPTPGTFRCNGLILDTCGTGPHRSEFEPSVRSKMAYLRCIGEDRNRDAALVAFVLGTITAGKAPALASASELHRVFTAILASWHGLRSSRSVDLADDDREWRTELIG